MADLTVTASSVLASAAATVVRTGVAGATVTAGQPVYSDSADENSLKPAQATAAKENATGIALHGAADGQPLSYVTKDSGFTPGATLIAGEIYVVSSAAAGGIAPIGDLTTGDYVTILGVAKSASVLNLDLSAGMRSQAAKP